MNEPLADLPSDVVETRDETFERDVIERSHALPVVVDFWAAWCQPCRMLAPLLESLTAERSGRLQLVKAEAEHNQQAAAQLRVEALPTVIGFVGGEPVDFFAGLLPPEQLAAWLDRLAATGELAALERQEAVDPAAAEAGYRRLWSEPGSPPTAGIGLARVLFATQRYDECRAVLDELAGRGYREPEAARLQAALELQAGAGADLAALQAAVDAAPGDLSPRLELARGLAAAGRHEEALPVLLDLVERERRGVGEPARLLMLDIFRVLGDDHPLTRDFRRQLAAALY